MKSVLTESEEKAAQRHVDHFDEESVQSMSIDGEKVTVPEAPTKLSQSDMEEE